MRATFPKTITFDLQFDSNLPLVTADRSQIDQVLLNLCVNACDAMPNGGIMTLDTSITSGAELREFFTGADADEYARVRVRDAGTGITPEVKAHIFQPFFTTKERSKSTGLGLSVVYSVVNNHRVLSSWKVRARRWRGLQRLPAAATGARIRSAPARANYRLGHPSPKLSCWSKMKKCCASLASRCWKPKAIASLRRKTAWRQSSFSKHIETKLDWWFCDLGLPRLGGRDAFMKMKESRPAVRVIVASGYLEPNMRSEILKAGVVDTIQKPYHFRELLEKIRGVIGEPEADDNQPRLF